MEITEPENLAYTYKVNPAGFTPPWNTSMDGVRMVPTDPPCGCGFIDNQEDVEGNIALIERGECSFVSKVRRAEEAGAIGADTTEREVSIPAAFLLGKNGQIIKKTLDRLNLPWAVINIPVNISRISPYKLNQPPWLVW